MIDSPPSSKRMQTVVAGKLQHGVSFDLYLAATAVAASGEEIFTDDSEEAFASEYLAALGKICARSRLEMGAAAWMRVHKLSSVMVMIAVGQGDAIVPHTSVDKLWIERPQRCSRIKPTTAPPTATQYLDTAVRQREGLLLSGCTFSTDRDVACWMELLFAYRRLHGAQSKIARAFREFRLSPPYLFDKQHGKRRRLTADIEASYCSLQTTSNLVL